MFCPTKSIYGFLTKYYFSLNKPSQANYLLATVTTLVTEKVDEFHVSHLNSYFEPSFSMADRYWAEWQPVPCCGHWPGCGPHHDDRKLRSPPHAGQAETITKPPQLYPNLLNTHIPSLADAHLHFRLVLRPGRINSSSWYLISIVLSKFSDENHQPKVIFVSLLDSGMVRALRVRGWVVASQPQLRADSNIHPILQRLRHRLNRFLKRSTVQEAPIHKR